LAGDLHIEQGAVLPLSVGGGTVAISGVVDLVAVTDARVQVIDFKTDRSRRAEAEYRKQLSVYWHVLAETYPDKDVDAQVFWTAEGELVEIEPIGMENLSNLVRVRSGG
jgi:ATP-dependent exoDNAse (exonuclease V) beta subunit